jgi:glyoxylase-like metal-dependent hydrolase (beta-lactamase superfamily II)
VRIEVPTGLPIGPVNAYVLTREPVTVVDPGPDTPGSWDALKAGLSAAGVGRFEVRQILLTHGHVDHFGLAARLRKDSGARVLAPAGDRAMIEDFHRTHAARRALFEAALAESGAPAPVRASSNAFFSRLDQLGEAVAVDEALADGDTFAGGGELFTAVRTPGHSAGATCYLGQRGGLLSGDTVIPSLTSLAAFGGRDGTSVGLGDHLASVNHLATLPVRLVLPGHRLPFRDLRGHAWESRRQFDARRAAILDRLQREHTTWELCEAIFGQLPEDGAFLGITEVLGHLELLRGSGAVRASGGEVPRYVRA